MGGDCCGGDPPAPAPSHAPSPAVAAASAAIAALKLADEAGKHKGGDAAPADGAPPARSHADHVAAMQAYIAQRIALFEQYHAREAAKVCAREREEARGRISCFLARRRARCVFSHSGPVLAFGSRPPPPRMKRIRVPPQPRV